MEVRVPHSRKVLACATVMEEMLPLLPDDMPRQVLDFGLHINPASLKAALQEAIDASAAEAETIILGYGFCSMAVMGLRANGCTLVVPRVDDCISIFLGSGEAYKAQVRGEPGTYYLTKGWIEVGDTPFGEYDRLVEKYGEKRADRLIRLSIKHYTRLALIDTGRGDDMTPYREYARHLAARWDLRFEEIQGSNDLVRRMLFGPWEGGSAAKDFIVVPPGEAIRYQHFFDMTKHEGSSA
jgi:hypothetical protein